MKLPNKVTSYKKSILAKFPVVLEALEKENMTPEKLYQKVKNKVSNISEFTDVLVCLYALNKIDFIDEEVLYYVENNTM
jgi:hypothetical protein